VLEEVPKSHQRRHLLSSGRHVQDGVDDMAVVDRCCASAGRSPHMTHAWTSDDVLFARARRDLYSAVIGDVLDGLGRRHQFLPPEIQPLREDMVVVGRAMPVLEAGEPRAPIADRGKPLPQPFGLMLRALDDLKAGEVYVCAGGASPPYASWGELMTTCARNRGATGVVIDGWSRDTRGVLALDFPCFARGRYAQDARTRGTVVDFRCRVRIGAVDIAPGDVIFGDLDGVVVIPREMEIDVFTAAWEKAFNEKRVFEAIKAGMGAEEAWDTYGVF
jgi:regulator of RNase E activity RraA